MVFSNPSDLAQLVLRPPEHTMLVIDLRMPRRTLQVPNAGFCSCKVQGGKVLASKDSRVARLSRFPFFPILGCEIQ